MQERGNSMPWPSGNLWGIKRAALAQFHFLIDQAAAVTKISVT